MTRPRGTRPTGLLVRLGTLGAAALFAACGATSTAEPGKAAPAFSLEASDGRTHSLESLTKNGDVFFYAIKEGCPVNAQAEDFFDQLARAYEGKVQFVGVANMDAERFAKWKEKFQPSYTVLLDPKKEVIGGLEMQRSPWLVHVDANGRVVESWPGYSALDLEDMGESMARVAKTQPVELDLDAAPDKTSYG